MSWTQPGQGYFTELNEALSTISFPFPKWRMKLVFKRTSGKDGGVQKYEFIHKDYANALYMTIDEPKKVIDMNLEYSDEDLEQWTDDMMPKGADTEDPKNQDKYWNNPFESQLKAAVKRQYPKFKLSIGG